MKHAIALAATLATSAFALAPAHAETSTYAIDPSHTFVSFEVSHFGTSTIRGRFDRKEGTVQLDRAARTGRVEITIDMGSINSGVPPFDAHLKSDDFFDVAKYPSARFVGNKLVFSGDKVTAVEGTLTLAGKTHPVTLRASQFNCYFNPMLKREVCGGDFEATILRSQWGINFGLPVVAPDAVRLVIQAEAIKQ